jgi:2-polyprenyl-3-methyl-5-hydroxy-6-metoxy-1,4-benzoquinol methylase
MILYSSKYRSTQEEIMDDFQLQGEEMESVLNDLKIVNTYLGGTSITLQGIKKLLKNRSKEQEITIVDYGCGDGEILRKCSTWGAKNNLQLKLIGLDANESIIKEAKERSKAYKNCTFKCVNIFFEASTLPKGDIALFTLFLHHFDNEKIETILNQIRNQVVLGIIINDLQRSYLAFNLFKLFSTIFIKTKIAHDDGLISVARGFKKSELQQFSEKIKGLHTIHWKWAFRYQWIIKKEED